ncbi:hypothetical protein A3G63_00635 [Candidatus Kaiserbacteria bacterium RIFCSPLOWO2_12_FULL_52_8]|uniref:Uncharacterized protein n=1 Tax=Candidatus Kaiserbacteria bacterium RIFCSPHIGHO2_01_FULL_53_31 TaxID=1798481 RepID=A0A1F6CJA8_9BACT|nr:MAG: hypothetical protein A2678_01075 [Candidatus Kaiserbacteria bacterium RIFCSPHIGHO2_01_FULL_53_31]OGG92668.1 MAG: hypothetical protein A3G63_00635 [Candidatus Kaiserbacteria bacterium RIFCSPLOWO2_12_FULL_52_8]
MNMDTKTSVGVAAAIIIVGAGAYYMLGRTAQAPVSQGTESSLGALLAAGVAQKCTFSDEQSLSSGTVYIANGKVRGDFAADANGENMQVHMIGDGITMHTWVEGMSSGFRTMMNARASSGSPAQSFDTNKQMNYNCSPWSTDNALFVLPSGVIFSETGIPAL